MEMALPLEDLSGLPRTEREARARQRAAQVARQPFDLSQPPLLRVALLKLDEAEHALLFAMHHIVSDGWSLQVLIGRGGAALRGLREGRVVAAAGAFGAVRGLRGLAAGLAAG